MEGHHLVNTYTSCYSNGTVTLDSVLVVHVCICRGQTTYLYTICPVYCTGRNPQTGLFVCTSTELRYTHTHTLPHSHMLTHYTLPHTHTYTLTHYTLTHYTLTTHSHTTHSHTTNTHFHIIHTRTLAHYTHTHTHSHTTHSHSHIIHTHIHTHTYSLLLHAPSWKPNSVSCSPS